MAHFIYEYSANLLPELDIAAVMAALHRVAADGGVFPVAGLRSRALRCDDYLVADGDPAKGFLHLSIRMGAGRPVEVRREVGEALFETLLRELQPVLAVHAASVSMELRELEKTAKFNHTNFAP